MSTIHDPGADAPEGATDSSRDNSSSTATTDAAATDASSPPTTEDSPPAAPSPASEAATAPAEPISADAGASAGDEPAAEPTPISFDDLALPQSVRDAIRAVGWDRPTPVQAAAFAPISEGRDVLVQSQTGTGKTGAFCLPWLAIRFEPGDPAATGVQLIVLTPTRELAKQVCDELSRLARFGEVISLPVYGGTAMQPQLAALKTGVHAVVGTPGRVLDHIRRRSLDLSRVRMVVLDEADEMLSMGFLEDIHAILEACPAERQTTLFSATVPTEIERIARRYMRSPIPLRLSGDEIAAAAIDHTFYSVTSAVKTRDLLDVVAVEEPATALVFCNTREEVNLVSSVLEREGFAAAPLSSDLTQAARERVLGWMREGRLRFLVATDVASRGIDISHISHVINYSFPENAESYVHRTGRTGRAGRAGKAISLISPTELGNFYYLKLQYPTIVFSESHLPPAEDLAAQRNELKLDQVSRRFPELVSPEWTLLARNLMKDPRGERVIAYLLSEATNRRATREVTLSEDGTAIDAADGPGSGRLERVDRGRGRGDRPGGGGGGGFRQGEGDGRRGRDRDRRGGRDDRPRDDRPRDGQAARDDRPRDGQVAGDDRPRDGQVAGDDRPRDDRPRDDRPRDDRPRGDRHRGERRTGDDRPRHDRPRDAQAPREGGDAVAAFGDGETRLPDDAVRDDAATGDTGTAPDGARAAFDGSGDPDARRRRRRRRRNREDGAPAGDATDVVGDESQAAALDGEGDDAIAASDELGGDADGEATTAPAAPSAMAEGARADDGAPQGGGRRRRRRRRRGGRPGAEGEAPRDAVAARPGEATAESDDEDGDDEEGGGEERDDDKAAAGDAAGPDGTGRRRRRRRRGRRRGGSAPEVTVAPVAVVVPERPAAQDEIVVDIDESELQLVRDEFGEIDELDDFTLTARRRGVLDTLAEEVELEDLSHADRPPQPAPDAADANGDGSADDGDDAGDDAGDGEESTDGTPSDDEAQRKRKRRRRRKKKAEAEPPPPPPLMVPPHKDFWEVWATHFNYRDFEDPASAEPEPPDPEPVAAPRREHQHRGEMTDSVASDDTWVAVRLSLGRSHGKKSAEIRDILADRAGLTGRAVRNLTVGERDTQFQIGSRSWPRVARAFAEVVVDGVSAGVQLVDDDASTSRPAEPIIDSSGEQAGDSAVLPMLAAAEPVAEASEDAAETDAAGDTAPDPASAP